MTRGGTQPRDPLPYLVGGAGGSRTPDLRRAKAALSHLSYGPSHPPPSDAALMTPHCGGVGVPGIEPGTSVLSGPRSNRLSYTPQPGTEPGSKDLNPRRVKGNDGAAAFLVAQAGYRSTWKCATHGREPWVTELPRKEVIQPHLPVRLPCYDFVPIAGPAFDGCLSCELAHRLQASPTFMT